MTVGVPKIWYDNRQLQKEERYNKDGKKYGIHKGWYLDGQ